MVTSVIRSYSSCSQAEQPLYAMEVLKGKMPANKDGKEEVAALEDILRTFRPISLKQVSFPFHSRYHFITKIENRKCIQDSSSLKERKELKAVGEQLLALQNRKDSWPTVRNFLIFTTVVASLVCGVSAYPYLALQIGISTGVWALAIQMACGIVVAVAIVSGIREGLYCKRLTKELPGKIRSWEDTVAVHNLDIPNKVASHRNEMKKLVDRINDALPGLAEDDPATVLFKDSKKYFEGNIQSLELELIRYSELLQGYAHISPNSRYGLSRLTA